MKRVISGLVFVPIFIALVQWGSLFEFYILVVGGILIGVWEYFEMTAKIGVEGYRWLGLALSFLLSLCFYIDGQLFIQWLGFALLSCFAWWWLADRTIRIALDQMSYTLFGVLLIAGTLGHLILIRKLENGSNLVFFIFLIVWFGDTTAYYGGRNFGNHLLAPEISPKKTIEGAIAGLAGNIVAGAVAHFWFMDDVFLTHCLIMGLFCGMIGQMGDMAESVLKRNAGVKDSGKLIPGHGGVLDRIDSLMFVAPLFYTYHKWVIVI